MNDHTDSISKKVTANTMRMFYRLLEEFDSYAIIATHSPLIIQEIPSKYIRSLTIHTPDNECFGENVTKITDDIFEKLL